jgi:hypothetical protein
MRPIEQPVYLEVNDSWPRIQGVGGFLIELEVPCNGAIADVTLWWGFQAADALGSPPSASVAVASSVPCPSSVDLEGSCTDPNGDIVSERWIVDGVLIEGSTTSIPFTAGHTLTLITRDSRGAASTDSRSVSCL